MKGEWSKHPFRVWYNFGTEIWITVFDIRKKMQCPCSYSAGCTGENSGDLEIHFGGLCGTWNNVRVQIVTTILCFLGALNLVQLWHRDLENGKQYDVAVDFHVFNWRWIYRRKLFNLPTQVLNHFLVSNTSAFFQKFHNVDSERLFGSFSLHFLSESHPFWNAPQTAPGAQYRASYLFCVTSTSITTWHYPLRVTRSNSQALFRCPPQSGEHPTNQMVLIISGFPNLFCLAKPGLWQFWKEDPLIESNTEMVGIQLTTASDPRTPSSQARIILTHVCIYRRYYAKLSTNRIYYF